MSGVFNSRKRCGIVLAGGEGQRLRRFVHLVKGSTLPKQYVNFIGTRSMLEHTYQRAEKLIPPEHLLTVVNGSHLGYPDVPRQLSSRPTGTVIVQPENRGTGPGVLLPLMHLYKRDPESTVAVFPSDHFILEEDLFIAYVGLAFYVAESDSSRLVLLGIEPEGTEPEYGYILPDGKVEDLAPLGVQNVEVFIEKPAAKAARELIVRGGLWNTMVMVFKTKTVLDLVRTVAPTLYSSFQEILKAIGSRNERYVVEEVYRTMKSTDFSRGFLETPARMHRSCISVLPVSGVFWSDWGSEHRVVSALKKTGYLGRLRGITESRLFRIWDGM